MLALRVQERGAIFVFLAGKVVVMRRMMVVVFVAAKVARLLVLVVKVHLGQDVAKGDVYQSARREKQNEASTPVKLLLCGWVIDSRLLL